MNQSHNRYKADLFNYQTILEQEELPPTLHCLSATTKMLLLSVLDPIAWKTRYIGDPDEDKIKEWREQAMVQLILDSCGDDLCELIASAIDDCDLVHQALITFAGQQGWSATTGDINNVLAVSIRDDNLLPDDYTCDDDHRYGMAVGLVNYIHNMTLEVFEKIELATNLGELAAEISDNVPFWEMAATGADIALWVQDTVYEAYIAAWSDTVRDEIACELWCWMVRYGTCHLSLDTIFDVYNDDALSGAPDISAIATAWLEWLFGLDMDTDILTVKISSMMGLLALRYGGSFGGWSLGIRTLATTVKLLADETDDGWEILCDECPDPEWLASIDFTVSDGGYVKDTVPLGGGAGEYVASVGWSPTVVYTSSNGFWQSACTIILNFSGGTYTLRQSTMHFNYTLGDWTSSATHAQWIMRHETRILIRKDATTDGDDQELNTANDTVTGATKHSMFMRSSNVIPEVHDYGNLLITGIDIRGIGPVPPELAAYIV